jgi:hypothetical protein
VLNSKGKVDLSHQYTHDGLDALVDAASSIASVGDVKVDRLYARKNAINRLANQLRKDKWSDEHADYAKVAFQKSVMLLEDIAKDDKFANTRPMIQDLKKTVEKLDKNVLLTKQKETVYNFFEKSNQIIQAFSRQCDWTM